MSKDSKDHSAKTDVTSKRAVALQYQSLDDLPSVVATGQGSIAERILEFAQTQGIPIKEDATLTELLSQVPKGEAISDESFSLVAEVLSFLYYADCKWRDEHKFLDSVME